MVWLCNRLVLVMWQDMGENSPFRSLLQNRVIGIQRSKAIIGLPFQAKIEKTLIEYHFWHFSVLSNFDEVLGTRHLKCQLFLAEAWPTWSGVYFAMLGSQGWLSCLIGERAKRVSHSQVCSIENCDICVIVRTYVTFSLWPLAILITHKKGGA